jgi:hypothetical protein
MNQTTGIDKIENGDDINVSSWDEFVDLVTKAKASWKATKAGKPLLFRGLGSIALKLQTTLERSGKADMPLSEYYRLIYSEIRPAVTAVTGIPWTGLPEPGHFKSKLPENRLDSFFADCFPFDESATDFLVYLRHHGFPSPLLDWSFSPFVAAFFTFRNPTNPGSTCDDTPGMRSIWMLQERNKWIAQGAYRISRIGEHSSGHKRHFSQNSAYTICTFFKDDEWRFGSFEKILKSGSKQDTFTRFNLPDTERNNVLEHLGEFNLNAYSLFNTEEALMETLASRVLGV